MATIDLTTNATLQTDYAENALDSTVTVSFSDGSGLLLGTLRIETARYRALAEVLATVAKALYPDSSSQPGYTKTNILLRQKSAKATFS